MSPRQQTLGGSRRRHRLAVACCGGWLQRQWGAAGADSSCGRQASCRLGWGMGWARGCYDSFVEGRLLGSTRGGEQERAAHTELEAEAETAAACGMRYQAVQSRSPGSRHALGAPIAAGGSTRPLSALISQQVSGAGCCREGQAFRQPGSVGLLVDSPQDRSGAPQCISRGAATPSAAVAFD